MYKLRTATIGVENDNGKRVTITLPEDAVLEVVSDYLADGMVDVLWNDRRISMFLIDLEERGEPVKRGVKYDWESDEVITDEGHGDNLITRNLKRRMHG